LKALRLDISGTSGFVPEEELSSLLDRAREADEALQAGGGPDPGRLGWMQLPDATGDADVSNLLEVGDRVRSSRQVLVVVGIGGSYMGARAAIDALTPSFGRNGTDVVFAGCDLTGDRFAELLDYLDGKDFAVNVISKSGTTLEPSVAFRILRDALEKRFGEEGARERIVATTDPAKGVLRKLSEEKGYVVFDIPPDIGGRFSLFTAAGLLPMAVSGIDVREMLEGARRMKAAADTAKGVDNPCLVYAAARNALHGAGKSIEVLAAFNSKLQTVCEWWKQLAGESEGKNGKGLLPASVVDTTDLHSLGQWIQEGPRIIFETFLRVAASRRSPVIPDAEGDPDGLNYLAGKTLDFANDAAFRGTDKAHRSGGVPTMTIEMAGLDSGCLGALFYFFERAIAVSGCLLGVNPFDQPGVEAYKRNMFKLLGKP
jgi:glucose-6-phosphate isomerase